MNTPQTSLLTTLWNAKTLSGERKQVAFVQSIPSLKSPADPITYGALDLDEEQQAKGTRKSETLTIPILYTEEQHDEIKVKADSGEESYWFVKLPETTATEPGKPLVYYFKASCDLSNDAIEIDGMLGENITLYRSTPVLENKGFPTE